MATLIPDEILKRSVEGQPWMKAKDGRYYHKKGKSAKSEGQGIIAWCHNCFSLKISVKESLFHCV